MTLKIYLYKDEAKLTLDKKPSFVISTQNRDMLQQLHRDLNSFNSGSYIKISNGAIFKKDLFYCAIFEE